VGNGPDCDDGFLLGINDGKRESPKQESSGVVLSWRPAFRSFTDCLSSSMQFFDKVQGCFGTALLMPGDCALNICDRALVVFNTLVPDSWAYFIPRENAGKRADSPFRVVTSNFIRGLSCLAQYFSELVLRRRLRRASTTIFRRMAAPFARAVEACSSPREPDAPCRLCPRHWPGTSLRRRD
jgi:hypothetical protein